MTIPIDIILKLVYEAFKALYKGQSERFENEWENDKQKIIKCLEAGDADCINGFIAKYSNL